VVTWAIWRTWVVRFDAMPFTESVRSFHVPLTPLTFGLAAELALRADLAGDAGDLVGERGELVDHLVDRGADAGELALDRLALDGQRHLAVQVAAGHGLHHERDLGGRADQVVDERVDRLDRLGPAARDVAQRGALGHAALAADDAADAVELSRERGVALGHLVEGALDVADQVGAPRAQARGEVAVAGLLQRGKQVLERALVELRVPVAAAVAAGRVRRPALRRAAARTCRHLSASSGPTHREIRGEATPRAPPDAPFAGFARVP
jgi:hypothetical protein